MLDIRSGRATLIAASLAGAACLWAGFAPISTAAAPGAAPANGSLELRLTWKMPQDVISASTSYPGFPSTPTNVSKLDGGLGMAKAIVVQAHDESGAVVAAATQLVMPRPGKTKVDTPDPYEVAYSIIYPGRGTLYAWCLEAAPDTMTDEFRKAMADPSWKGMILQKMTIGPRPDGKCAIDHATGEFEGMQGSFHKVHRMWARRRDATYDGFVGDTQYVIELHR
jgi:hypothetical protein